MIEYECKQLENGRKTAKDAEYNELENLDQLILGKPLLLTNEEEKEREDKIALGKKLTEKAQVDLRKSIISNTIKTGIL